MSAYTDNNVNKLIINKLTRAQYDSITDKSPTELYYITDDDTYVNKAYVDSVVSSTYRYKGSVADRASLPTTDLTVGDVYNLQDTGMNVAWTGTEWDELGATVNLDNYALKTDIPSLEGYATQTWVESKGYLTEHQSLAGKQDVLVSGTNIKTINGTSILGSGDITISGGSGGVTESRVNELIAAYMTANYESGDTKEY